MAIKVKSWIGQVKWTFFHHFSFFPKQGFLFDSQNGADGCTDADADAEVDTDAAAAADVVEDASESSGIEAKNGMDLKERQTDENWGDLKLHGLKERKKQRNSRSLKKEGWRKVNVRNKKLKNKQERKTEEKTNEKWEMEEQRRENNKKRTTDNKEAFGHPHMQQRINWQMNKHNNNWRIKE